MNNELKEYADLVKVTRQAQNDYFHKGRTPFLLNQAKALERKLDQETDRILNSKPEQQAKLF